MKKTLQTLSKEPDYNKMSTEELRQRLAGAFAISRSWNPEARAEARSEYNKIQEILFVRQHENGFFGVSLKKLFTKEK